MSLLALMRGNSCQIWANFMMTLSNENIFRVTGTLCGEFTAHQWIHLKKASDAELWCFLRFAPWINGWVNNGEAGDLRCHRAQYDVIVTFAKFSLRMCYQHGLG